MPHKIHFKRANRDRIAKKRAQIPKWIRNSVTGFWLTPLRHPRLSGTRTTIYIQVLLLPTTIPWRNIPPLVFCPSKAKILFKEHNSLSLYFLDKSIWIRHLGAIPIWYQERRAQDHLLLNRSAALGGIMYYSASAHAFFFRREKVQFLIAIHRVSVQEERVPAVPFSIARSTLYRRLSFPSMFADSGSLKVRQHLQKNDRPILTAYSDSSVRFYFSGLYIIVAQRSILTMHTFLPLDSCRWIHLGGMDWSIVNMGILVKCDWLACCGISSDRENIEIVQLYSPGSSLTATQPLARICFKPYQQS